MRGHLQTSPLSLGSWAHSSGLSAHREDPKVLPATSCPGWLKTCIQQHNFLGNFSGPGFPWAESLQLILVFLAETVRGKSLETPPGFTCKEFDEDNSSTFLRFLRPHLAPGRMRKAGKVHEGENEPWN